MKTFAIILAAFCLVQVRADRDWSNIRPLDIEPFGLLPKAFSNPRIVGGNEAEPNSKSYQAALLIEVPQGTAFCGGSIMSDKYILTAAHCVDSTKQAECVLGAHNIHEEEATQQKIVSNEFIVHEKWSRWTLENDIALVKLPKKILFKPEAQPVQLPRRSDIGVDLTDKVATVSGWGKDSDKATGVSPILRYVEVPVMNHEACKAAFLGVPGEGHICTVGKGGRGACSGDSGGPLVLTKADNEIVQIGIVSFGIAFGCEIGWPSAFTRTTSYLDWISEHSNVTIRE